jgi:MFS family permease
MGNNTGECMQRINIIKNIKEIHYGWMVTLGCFIILMYSIGFTINLSSVLLMPLINHVGISKGEGSSIIGLQNLIGLFTMMLMGKLYITKSIRKACLVFGFLIGSGYLVFSISTSLTGCYLAAVLIGAGYGGSSMIPVSILMTRWFDEKRGLALGFACLGTGVSTVIFAPIIGWLIENHGLPEAYRFLFLIVIIGTIISYLLIRDFPAHLGLAKYGQTLMVEDSEFVNCRDLLEESGDTVEVALKSPRFYLIAFSMFLLGMSLTPTVAHIGAHLSTFGYSTTFSSLMMAIYGAVMLVFKPLYGAIIDRCGGYLSNYYIYAMWMIGLFFGLLVSKSIVFAYLFAIFCGIGAPLGNMMPSFIISEIFGLRNYTQLFSINKVLFTLGASVGAVIPGVIADMTGYYTGALMFYLFIVSLSLFIVQKIIHT